MNDISLEIKQEDVYSEIDKSSSYTSASMQTEENAAYERLRFGTYQQEMAERFWEEAKDDASLVLSDMIVSVEEKDSNNNEIYKVNLEISDLFPLHLRSKAEKELFSFFVKSILSKWYDTVANGQAQDSSTNKTMDGQAQEAPIHLESMMNILQVRQRPKMRDRDLINFINSIEDVEVEIE